MPVIFDYLLFKTHICLSVSYLFYWASIIGILIAVQRTLNRMSNAEGINVDLSEAESMFISQYWTFEEFHL